MMINSSFIAKKKPEITLSVRIRPTRPAGESLEAAYVRKSISAKYPMPEQDAHLLQVLGGGACTKCDHRYLPGTKDADYFTNSKPCLYCDNPHIGCKVRSVGCFGLVLLLATGVTVLLA